MGRLKTIKEVTEALGVLYVFAGFFIGVLFMIWFVPHTHLINTIHDTQQCASVTIYGETQDFCKQPTRDKEQP